MAIEGPGRMLEKPMSRSDLRLGLSMVAFAFAAGASVAHARNGGIASSGCEGCHGGGAVPQITLAASPATFSPGSTVTLTVTIPTPSGGVGGLYLRTNDVGALAVVSGQPTRLLSAFELVHSAPKSSSGGSVVFQAQWTAPAQAGAATLEVWGVAGNADGRSGGDGASGAVLNVVFGCTGATYFRDFDGDGFGATSSGTTVACQRPAGYALVGGDCDENDKRVYPGAPELCDGHDNNCDGAIDEGLPRVPLYPDHDGDGYGVPGPSPGSGCGPIAGYGVGTSDCDDADPQVHPNATEICNGRDENCNNRIDEGVRPICGVGMCARYAITCSGEVCTPGDPGAESCNGLDDDCDGVVDNGADLCGTGHRCLEGRCVDGGVAPPTLDGGPGGSSPAPLPPPASGCSSAPGAVGLLALLAMAWRSRSARGS